MNFQAFGLTTALAWIPWSYSYVCANCSKCNKFEGRKAYTKHVDAIYKQNDISWFTPVELFKVKLSPYFKLLV